MHKEAALLARTEYLVESLSLVPTVWIVFPVVNSWPFCKWAFWVGLGMWG